MRMYLSRSARHERVLTVFMYRYIVLGEVQNRSRNRDDRKGLCENGFALSLAVRSAHPSARHSLVPVRAAVVVWLVVWLCG